MRILRRLANELDSFVVDEFDQIRDLPPALRLCDQRILERRQITMNNLRGIVRRTLVHQKAARLKVVQHKVENFHN